MRYKYRPRNYFENHKRFVPYINAYRALGLFIRTEGNVDNHPALYQRYTENLHSIAKEISVEFFEMKEDFSKNLIPKDLYLIYLEMYRKFLGTKFFFTVCELHRTDIEDEIKLYIPIAA